jgi:hypothetical protein
VPVFASFNLTFALQLRKKHVITEENVRYNRGKYTLHLRKKHVTAEEKRVRTEEKARYK